jgi:UTP--glucose-1-phosphate uridylyltransferase
MAGAHPQVTKAIIPAAGFGTRFLPIAKAVPKEMLPVIDRPVIDYVIDEAIQSGITDILLIISRDKRAIEEYFNAHPALEANLTSTGKHEAVAAIRAPGAGARLHFIWQPQMNGLGDAVLLGKTFAGADPVAVLLGDTIVTPHPGAVPATRQLIDAYAAHGGSTIALEEVEPSRVSRYGIAGGEWVDRDVMRVTQWVEKPKPEAAPSRMAVASRYLFTPGIFRFLESTARGHGGEIQLTDAMHALAQAEPTFGRRLAATRHDIGNPLGFIQANLMFALQRPDLAATLGPWIKDVAARLDPSAGSDQSRVAL